MIIEKKPLSDIDKHLIINLMNQPLVKRHMPLASKHTGEAEYAEFIAAKEKIWSEHGYGPWAFVVDDHFVGWGGLQPEGNDVEIALVLNPEHWGLGNILYKLIIQFAFKEMKLESVIILFPPSRTRIKAILKAGFHKDGEVMIEGQSFIRYRLYAQAN